MKRMMKLLFAFSLMLLITGCSSDINTLENSAPVIVSEEVYTVNVDDFEFDLTDLIYINDDYDGVSFITNEDILYNNLDVSKLGEYTVTVTVTDTDGKSSNKDIKINVIDEIAPSIVLNGESELSILLNSTYIDPGVMITDNVDDEFVVMTYSNLDSSTLGDYVIEYKAKDKSSNESITITRIIHVVSVSDTISLSSKNVTTEAIEFSINVIDESSFNEVQSISLYEGSTLISKLEDVEERKIEGLTEGTKYTLKVTYTFKFNGELQTRVITKDIETDSSISLNRDGFYTSKDDVALYLFLYHELPDNFMTKSEAGSHISSIWTYENQASIGGDHFGNYEGLLPEKSGRYYYEVDINYHGGSRGAERIVYSNDGFIFYTGDHYDSFVLYDSETGSWVNYSKYDEIFD